MTAGEGACIMDGLERFSISGGVNWISTPGAGEWGGLQAGSRSGKPPFALLRTVFRLRFRSFDFLLSFRYVYTFCPVPLA